MDIQEAKQLLLKQNTSNKEKERLEKEKTLSNDILLVKRRLSFSILKNNLDKLLWFKKKGKSMLLNPFDPNLHFL
jgi:hypothetical protein